MLWPSLIFCLTDRGIIAHDWLSALSGAGVGGRDSIRARELSDSFPPSRAGGCVSLGPTPQSQHPLPFWPIRFHVSTGARLLPSQPSLVRWHLPR
jgi:hypothetical protein